MAERRGRQYEPRYLWCETCTTLIEPVPRGEEDSPLFGERIVKAMESGHTLAIQPRSVVRALAGDLAAVSALDRLQGHWAGTGERPTAA